jgi:hypothetical protein
MSERVLITEHVRLNADGSSDHIHVIDGELDRYEHCDIAPYVNLDPEIAWFIRNSETMNPNNNRR